MHIHVYITDKFTHNLLTWTNTNALLYFICVYMCICLYIFSLIVLKMKSDIIRFPL